MFNIASIIPGQQRLAKSTGFTMHGIERATDIGFVPVWWEFPILQEFSSMVVLKKQGVFPGFFPARAVVRVQGAVRRDRKVARREFGDMPPKISQKSEKKSGLKGK